MLYVTLFLLFHFSGNSLRPAVRANRQFPDDRPADSLFISGNFYLEANQILGMKLNLKGDVIHFEQDRTFFGYYQLHRY